MILLTYPLTLPVPFGGVELRMGGPTATAYVVRMPSGNIEFTIDGPIDDENRRFYMTPTDARTLCDQIREMLAEG